MTKLKVMTIVGTRPEIIRLSEVIKACDRYFDHVLVHTGQNWDYTLNEIFFEELSLRQPDYFLNAAGDNLGVTMGNILSKSYELMSKVKPDALLILGDTNSCLSAISAKRLKIPIFHMEAGNRCFDQNVPEEINRKIVDHTSDINLAYTEHSRRYLLSEGIHPASVFVTGSPMREVLNRNIECIKNSIILNELNLEPEGYFLVSAHREENIDIEKNRNALVAALNGIAEEYNKPVIYSTHPRSWKQFVASEVVFHPRIQQMKPFGFIDYNRLQMNAYCVLSDSGTLSEEAAMLKFPAVLIRTSTERPEVIDKGSVVIGGIHTEGILQSVGLSRAMYEQNIETAPPFDYLDCNVSAKVVRIIQSYTSQVNSNTWKKQLSEN